MTQEDKSSMVNVTSVNLSAPADWQAFERLTRELFESEWQTDDDRAKSSTVLMFMARTGFTISGLASSAKVAPEAIGTRL
jgi:hypothetical protein